MDQYPASAERTIMSVTNTTTATIDAALDSDAGAGTYYVISDPVDIEVSSMHSAFLALCELEFSLLSDRNAQDISRREMRYRDRLRIAMAADSRNMSMGNANVGSEEYYARYGDVTVR